jgi:type II secretory pathway pseudopilin PulG
MTERASLGPRAHRSFTLVEMVVVIGIIVVLAALTFAVGVAVVQNSEVRQTEATIRLLDAAVREWEARSDRKISAGPAAPGAVYDIEQADTETLQAASERITEALFAIISRNASVKEILAKVDPQFVKRETIDDGSGGQIETFEFRDAWGNLIVAVLPGRPWVTADPYYRDDDGTIRTQIELTCGPTANRQICFVSAGPDGQYGDIENDVIEPARDNVYSYPTDVVQ